MNAKFKVGIGIPCLMVGGTEMQTLQLVKVLLSMNFEPIVICYFEYESNMVKMFESEGVTVDLLNYQRSIGLFGFLLKFKTYLRSQKLKIFHVQYMAPGALPILAAKLAGVEKILATVHQPYTQSHGIFSKLILKISSKLCDSFIAVSKSAEKSWFGSSHLLNPKNNYTSLPKHFTIYNSVDAKLVRKLALSDDNDLIPRRSLSDSKVIIGTIARLSSVKGIDILIIAFEELLKSHEDCELWLVGDGEEKENLLILSEKLSLNNKIVFFGKREWSQAIKILSKMDIVVLPSRFEAFGLAAAEALALGKPVVASDTFGLKEVIKEGKTGFLFPMGNSSALAQCLLELIRNEKSTLEIAKNGAIDISLRFDISVFNSQINIVYSNLAKDLA